MTVSGSRAGRQHGLRHWHLGYLDRRSYEWSGSGGCLGDSLSGNGDQSQWASLRACGTRWKHGAISEKLLVSPAVQLSS